MPVTPGNVIVGIATLYIAPANTTPPLDTLAQGTPWLTPWASPGATEQGVSLLSTVNTTDINIEEQSTPAVVTVASRVIEVDVVLAEDTVANMKTAYGGGTIATVAPGTTQVGKSTLTLSDTLDQLAVGFEGVNSFGFWRRVYIPNVLSIASVTTAYRRAAANRQYAAKFRAICPPSAITITDMTAPHS